MKALKCVVSQTKELEKIESFRLGTIIKMDLEKNCIWIDFEENPSTKPLLAKLGTPWVSDDELNLFKNRIDTVKLEFLDGNPLKPIIRDLYFSVNEMNKSKSNPLKNKIIEVEADEIILRGRKQIIIQSGDARTVYKAEGAEIIHEAEEIDSSASTSNRIKGGTILLN